jgi:hypothetical protein
MFESKAGAYPNGETFRCSTLGLASGQHKIKLESPDKDKHSSLLQSVINYERKFFFITLKPGRTPPLDQTWIQFHKPFLIRH